MEVFIIIKTGNPDITPPLSSTADDTFPLVVNFNTQHSTLIALTVMSPHWLITKVELRASDL